MSGKTRQDGGLAQGPLIARYPNSSAGSRIPALSLCHPGPPPATPGPTLSAFSIVDQAARQQSLRCPQLPHPGVGGGGGSWGRTDGESCPTKHPVLSFPPVLDMQQTYDMWLKKHNPGKPGEGTPISSREGEKQIQMPTDYADIMVTASPMFGPAPKPDLVGRWGGLSHPGGIGLGKSVRNGHPRRLCPPPDGLPLLALRQKQQQ